MRRFFIFKAPYILLVMLGLSLLTSCAGKRAREARLKEREEISRSSQMYCQFVSGEDFPDIDVKINIEMGKKCEKEKHFSISHYVTPSKITGMMFCCHTKAMNLSKPDEASPSVSRSSRVPTGRMPSSVRDTSNPVIQKPNIQSPSMKTPSMQGPSTQNSNAPSPTAQPERSVTPAASRP